MLPEPEHGLRASVQDEMHDPSHMCQSVHAQSIRVRGVVQGVGFRPFAFRIAHAHGIRGWVLNDSDGVRVHAEGGDAALVAFDDDLTSKAPPAARIDEE